MDYKTFRLVKTWTIRSRRVRAVSFELFVDYEFSGLDFVERYTNCLRTIRHWFLFRGMDLCQKFAQAR